MKKIIVALLTFLIVFAFCGCKQKSDMFIVVESGVDYTIYQHKDTGVYYIQFEKRGITPIPIRPDPIGADLLFRAYSGANRRYCGKGADTMDIKQSETLQNLMRAFSQKLIVISDLRRILRSWLWTQVPVLRNTFS